MRNSSGRPDGATPEFPTAHAKLLHAGPPSAPRTSRQTCRRHCAERQLLMPRPAPRLQARSLAGEAQGQTHRTSARIAEAAFPTTHSSTRQVSLASSSILLCCPMPRRGKSRTATPAGNPGACSGRRFQGRDSIPRYPSFVPVYFAGAEAGTAAVPPAAPSGARITILAAARNPARKSAHALSFLSRSSMSRARSATLS